MNRLPRHVDHDRPGRVALGQANHGAPTSGTVGPHQASSIRSSAAPSFSPARMPSPVLALAPTVHSVVIGARWYFSRICSLCSNPPQARMTPRRARISRGSAIPAPSCRARRRRAPRRPRRSRSVSAVLSRTGTPACCSPMRSGADRAPGPCRPGSCRSPSPTSSRSADLQAAQHAARVALQLVEPDVILLHHDHVQRHLAVVGSSPGSSAPSLRALNGFGSIDRPPLVRPAPRGSSRSSRGTQHICSGECSSTNDSISGPRSR